MSIIGFSGGPDHLGSDPIAPGLSPLFFHDSAAALVVEGEVVFAVEEERLTRQKHTNAFPVYALRAADKMASTLGQPVDTFAFFFEEAFYDHSLGLDCRSLGLPPPPPVRSLLATRLSSVLDRAIAREQIVFVNHHLAHAQSAWHASNFEEALVLVIDGNGEHVSASLYETRDGRLHHRHNHPASQSIGHFYRKATRLAGFRDFEEYKFMGLAPYGRAETLDTQVSRLLELQEDGAYSLDSNGLEQLASRSDIGQWHGSRPNQATADFAAAIQRLCERTVLHLLRPHAKATSARRLCLAGGVAQNCVMNSRIAQEAGFEAVHAYSAAFDAGAAIGAALCAASAPRRPAQATTPFLGPPLETEDGILTTLEAFGPLCRYERLDDPVETAAALLSEGAVIGFAQGRSEFGPRALGARSILADPRPMANWSRINLAIKQRESFRPFAPAALAEAAAHWFDLPQAAANLGDMTFVSRVRPERRDQLGAVTHVDGSARLQCVTRTANPVFHRLITAFARRTACPVLLNTSFNNSHEPIVQNARDAVRTFLTTELDALVLGPFLVHRAGTLAQHLQEMEIRPDPFVRFEANKIEDGVQLVRPSGRSITLAVDFAHRLLPAGSKAWHRPDQSTLEDHERAELIEMVERLWRERLIDMRHAK